jgi:hypothetical protein
VLRRLWFEAPILDDYYIALAGVMQMLDAQSASAWLAVLVAPHSEHRIAVVRAVAWGVAAVAGEMDFRLLTLLGNFTVLGLALLAWAEFREAVAAPLIGAAAILLMQWSYYEASIMATAALPNIGVVFFSCACLFFATRPTAAASAAALAFGVLAVGSQANGLFALPLAALAAAFLGRRRRAVLFAVAALALWAAYFWHYERPWYRPSPALALLQPVAAGQYFLMVVGGIVPGRWPPIALGAAMLAVLAWLAWRGAWRRFPAATLHVAFVLASIAAITAGRVVSGGQPSPRYAIYPTWLLVIAFLASCAELRLSGRRFEAIAIAASVVAATLVSWTAWRWAADLSRAGHMLVKVQPADAGIVVPDPYPWTLHPGPLESRGILAAAERRGLYAPPQRVVHAPALRAIANVPGQARTEGVLDEVIASGARVKVSGWSPIAATTPGRTLAVYPAQPATLARYELVARPDVAMTMRDAGLVVSGFRMELEYPSEDAASRAAESLCVVAEAPGHQPALLHRAHAACGPASR